jgi:glycosyltransferase involved in cell wall biosynthesis
MWEGGLLDGAGGHPAGGELVNLIYHGNMSRLAVFLTVYNRLENLERTLKELDEQYNKDFDLYIVNNTNRDISKNVSIPATVIDMYNQKKMYGRFFAVRDVLKEKPYEIIAFLDDDISIPKNYIDYCYRQFEPDTVKSFWAFRIFDDYWKRKKLAGKELGQYAGAGGLLAPSGLFMVPELYKCPKEYWIIDDLWMSHCIAAYTDYKIKIFNVSIKFLDDKKATYLKIKPLKSEFTKEFILPFYKN